MTIARTRKSFARGAAASLSFLASAALGCNGDKAAGSPFAGSAAPTPSVTAPSTAGSSPPSAAGGTGSVVTAGAQSVRPLTPPTAGTGAAPVATAGSGAPSRPIDTPMAGAQVPTTPSSADWTTMGYDPGSTYFNRAETKLTKANAASLAVAYTVEMGGPVYGAPLQIGDKIYATSTTATKALEAATGKVLWSVTPGTQGSLSYAEGTLYLNTGGSRMIALSAADGKMLWTKSYSTTPADGISSPIVAGDLVLVGGSNGGIELGGGAFRGFVSAIDRKTGETAWSTYTVPEGSNGASIWSSLSADVAGGVAYAGTGNNYGMPATDTSDAILAFDLKTGTIAWKAQRTANDTFRTFGGGPDADFGANPVLYEIMVNGVLTKVVSAGDKGGSAHAIRRDDGMVLWTRKLGNGSADGGRGIFTNSAWTGKHMLFALNEGGPATLFALDGATGDVAWMRKLDGQVWGRTAVANGVAFVGSGTNLLVIDADTGDILKQFPSNGGTVASTITVSNGRVAFGEGMTWSTAKNGSTLTVLAVP